MVSKFAAPPAPGKPRLWFRILRLDPRSSGQGFLRHHPRLALRLTFPARLVAIGLVARLRYRFSVPCGVFNPRCPADMDNVTQPPQLVKSTWTTYLQGVDGYYDPTALADLLGIARTSVHRYRVRGDIPPPDEYVGRTPVWRKAAIDEWLARRPGHGWRKGRRKSGG